MKNIGLLFVLLSIMSCGDQKHTKLKDLLRHLEGAGSEQKEDIANNLEGVGLEEWQGILQELIVEGAGDNSGSTPLIRASENGYLEILKELVEKGSDIEAKNKDGYTALIRASQRGYFDIVKCLVESGADINAKDNDGDSALIHASIYGRSEIAKYFVDKGADTSEMTIIEWSGVGWLEKVQECINVGANVNAKDSRGSGSTALIRDRKSVV